MKSITNPDAKYTFLTCLIFATLIFAFNAIIPSSLNGFLKFGSPEIRLNSLIDSKGADEALEFRKSIIDFNKRPVLISIQSYLSSKYSIPNQLVFNIVNWIALFVFLYLSVLLSEKLNSANFNTNRYLLYIVTSFSIIFAFLGGIHTYDDILQYVFLSLFLLTFLSKKLVISIIFLGLASIIRETSLLYLVFIFTYYILNKELTINRALLFLLPLLLYLAFISIYLDKMEINGLEADTVARTEAFFYNISIYRETFSIVLIMISSSTILLIRSFKASNQKALIYSSLILLLLNTIIVFVFALAREARLFYLPLIIIIPIISPEISYYFRDFYSKIRFTSLLRISFYIIISTFLGFIFYETEMIGTGIIYKSYITIYVFIHLIIFITPNVPNYKNRLKVNSGLK